MHQEIYHRLKEVARGGGTITYGEIAPLAGLDMERADHRNQIAEVLDEISTHEHEHGRPLLSAVVVHAGDSGGTPGPGFFKMAKRHGIQRGVENTAFFVHELTRVYECWRTK